MSAGGKAPYLQLSARWIPEKSDSGKLYTSLSYFVTNRVAIGADYRPLVDKVAFNANVRAVLETESRPGVVIGSATDEFGDVSSRHYYATVSKHLGEWNNVEVSPYLGAAYIEELEDLREIGGLHLKYEKWSTLLQYTGVDWHLTLSYALPDAQVISLIAFDMDKIGLAYFVRL